MSYDYCNEPHVEGECFKFYLCVLTILETRLLRESKDESSSSVTPAMLSQLLVRKAT